MTLWNLVNPGYGPIALNDGVGFSLDTYLASLSDGFYFDFTKTDRHFQESTGITLADDVGEAIGLALDQRTWGGKTPAQVLAEQTELLAPGSWSMSVAGGTSTATESPAGTLNLTGDGTNAARGDQSFATETGKTYRLTQTSSIGVSLDIGTSQGGTQVLSGAAPGSGETSRVFVAGGTTTWVRYRRTTAGLTTVSAISCNLIPGNHGIQATGTLKGLRQTTGNKFDGSDDNNLTPYLAATGNNFILARTTVPATLGATQVVAGASGASANRIFLGINTSGFACAGVGSDSTSTIFGTSDLRDTEADIAVTCDGTTVRLIVNGVVEYEAAQNSTPTTSIPFRVGGLNNNGTGGSYYGGTVKEALAGRDFLTVSRFNQIINALPA